jgi:mannan endo-1,4-beta-mannosidase
MKNKTIFKFLFTTLLFTCCYVDNVVAQTPDATVEAETGVREGGVTVAQSISGYSGTGYVTNFVNSGDKLTVTMKVPAKGFYKLVIRYQSEYKEQNLYVNGSGPSIIKFPNSATFTDVEAGKYLLYEGDNTFKIEKNWGWTNIDKFSLYSVQKNTYSITPNLVNPNASAETKSLYTSLVSNFNSKIITGQTSDYYDKINPIASKSPMLRAFDFQPYTQGYSWKWDNATQKHTFGWEDRGTTEDIIDWYKKTEGKGIVSIQWHWHSPSGGTAGTNTFYTEFTSFDVTKAVQPGTTENTLIIRDIDSIATQLKKLQKAGIPVLWRPLHEAGGAWFWWGAKGPSACRKLFNIVFDRLQNHHALNNLIWVWSTPETDWYPGNDSIDIVGYDSYPGEYNYDPQKAMFDVLYKMVNGEKLIAMTENGPIPSIDDCLNYDAPWLYFMSWSDLVTKQNSNGHIYDVYNNSKVLTLGGSNTTSTVSLKSGDLTFDVFPNPAHDVLNVKGIDIKKLEVLDLNGRSIFVDTNPKGFISTSELGNGIYILKVTNSKDEYKRKFMIQR